MANILISACLMGYKVRYDGEDLCQRNPPLQTLIAEHNLHHFCPEVSAGLAIPRAPAEIQYGEEKTIVVKTIQGEDVSNAFELGAELALAYCKEHAIKYAILTESSPSCGSENIYNGTFTGTKTPGQGITTALLRASGIEVFNQFNIEHLIRKLKSQ